MAENNEGFLIYSVEDDKDIALIINKVVSKQSYGIKTFYDGKSFLEAFKKKRPNMVLLDMMLPDIPGSEILRTIRDNEENDDIDIIIISANHMLMDKVEGLDLGADDYIEKPFNILELMSRITAKVRRHHHSNIVKLKDVLVDLDRRTVEKGGVAIELTTKEFDILAFLINKNGEIASRDELYSVIWGASETFEGRAIDMHIKSIREKLNDKNIIKAVYGIGYKISV
jgi:two-component system alkaline phosphatase synthesis response regulator PhoP